MNLLDDYDLLDLGAFKHCLSLGTCAMIKNNTLSIFMLSGSIQFSIPVQFSTNHAFIKIGHLVSMYNVKDTYICNTPKYTLVLLNVFRVFCRYN